MSNVPPLDGPAVSSPQMSPAGPMGSTPSAEPVRTQAQSDAHQQSPSHASTNTPARTALTKATSNRAVIGVVALVIVVVAFLIGRGDGGSDTAVPGTGADTTLAPGTTVSPEETMPSSMLDVALQFHNQGRLDDALRAYEAVLAVDPTNKFAFYNIGVIAQGREQYEAAIENYDKVLALDSNFNPALYNRGLVYRDTNQTDKAIADLEAVVTADPKNASAMWNLGKILVAEGRTDEGAKLIADALVINPALDPASSGG